MSSSPEPPFCATDPSATQAAWAGVSAAFAALGRVFLCLDRDFHVLHASSLLEGLLGSTAARPVTGLPIADLLGEDLFGPAGTLRQALLVGERREGWRAAIQDTNGQFRAVSVTVAPFEPLSDGVCDPRVAYVVVLRPGEHESGDGAPTVFAGLVARSTQMGRVFRLVADLEHSDATVLLSGESGTGKEMVARAIHAHSTRRQGPFVAVNCAALPGDLLESELFGHVRGAFTGAVRDRLGRFEAAAGGTLFLDEIGDLPLQLQVKLLRVLQEHAFERVGETRSRTTDARIVAATNVDLRRAVADGRFRDDLYYRLRVVPIEIAPLRERREDIEPLAQHLLARVTARQGRALRFSPDTLRALLQYAWPGNVRELENALEYAVAVCKGQTVHPEDLPDELQRRPLAADALPTAGTSTAPNDERERARVEIRAMLDAHHWRRDRAAQALGISRATLWRRMRELGLIERES